MARRIREDASITRNHILDAAVECFSEQGVSQTTLDAIAQKAGVTRGAIYWHFEDKVDLFSAMIERLVCPLRIDKTERLRLMRENPLGFIHAATNKFLEKFTHDPNFCRVFEIFLHKCEYVGELAAIRHKYLEERESENHIDIILQAFTLAQKKGQIGMALTPHQATIALISLTDGMIFNWTKSKRQMFPMESYSTIILDAFFDMLQAGAKHP
ncbi:MAG: TetR family transcriptional regulator [Zoogloeaceae bacterium]|jgi:TetR/AcrR family acrAB operon transcriptional repressor|nr:TetR family transcriptional regulator [Zoogloeaceae bacterium]